MAVACLVRIIHREVIFGLSSVAYGHVIAVGVVRAYHSVDWKEFDYIVGRWMDGARSARSREERTEESV